MNFEVFEDKDVPGQWRAEAFGEGGECYVTVFSGDDAETRAREYAAWASENSAVVSQLLHR